MVFTWEVHECPPVIEPTWWWHLPGLKNCWYIQLNLWFVRLRVGFKPTNEVPLKFEVDEEGQVWCQPKQQED